MKENIDIPEIQKKLCEKLKPSGWSNILKTFILSSDFEIILKKLYLESRSKVHFTPLLKDLFKAFEECPYDQLKVVIVGQDPYPQINTADGIAFSCSIQDKTEASLNHIFKAIDRELMGNRGYTGDPNLKRWSNQGILMLNSALTVTIGKPGTHYELWKPFMRFLFDMLGYNNPGLIYGFMGLKAKYYEDLLPDNTHKFFTSHPASASYRAEEWDTKRFFKDIHECCRKNFAYEIIW